jgi:hypothetical protein
LLVSVIYANLLLQDPCAYSLAAEGDFFKT